MGLVESGKAGKVTKDQQRWQEIDVALSLTRGGEYDEGSQSTKSFKISTNRLFKELTEK